MSTNLEYRAGERQRKRESRRKASEAQINEKRATEAKMKICSGGDKMGNANSHQFQRKVKMRGSAKKKKVNVYDISSIKRVTKKFHVVVMQNNGKEMYKKSVLHVQSCFFW